MGKTGNCVRNGNRFRGKDITKTILKKQYRHGLPGSDLGLVTSLLGDDAHFPIL
jgi:hypothetical protein